MQCVYHVLDKFPCIWKFIYFFFAIKTQSSWLTFIVNLSIHSVTAAMFISLKYKKIHGARSKQCKYIAGVCKIGSLGCLHYWSVCNLEIHISEVLFLCQKDNLQLGNCHMHSAGSIR